jgi:hypothetical protein
MQTKDISIVRSRGFDILDPNHDKSIFRNIFWLLVSNLKAWTVLGVISLHHQSIFASLRRTPGEIRFTSTLQSARPGWDNRILDEMREKIATQLREFWDAGIRGPDFVWAATGPALEAYSYDPRFSLRIEIGRDAPPPPEVVNKLNKLLGNVSKDLRLK